MDKLDSQTKLTLGVVMLASFITPFMSNAINLAIPSIGLEFGVSQSLLNWVVSSFLIATAAFLLPFGRLADQFGRKKVFLTGMILLSASSLACALAASLPALIAFRVIQGIASAMIFGTTTAILTSVVPPQRRGKALGLNSAATYIGLSAGPVLGGLLTGAFTWRGVFVFNLLLALAVIVLTLWKIRGEWKGAAARIDGWGIVLCIAAQAFLLFGLSDLTAGLGFQTCFLLGIALTAAFFEFEKRHADPLIPVKAALKNRAFAFSNLAALINYSATFALGFLLSLYLQSALGFSTETAGLILLIQPVLMAALSPVMGALSDRIQPAVLASLGMGLTALGLFFFVFLTTQTPLWHVVVNLAFIGFGFSLFAAPNTNAIMSSVDKSLYGVGSSVMGNMRLLGQSISMAIVSLVTSYLMGTLSIGQAGYVEALIPSIRLLFTIFSALCVLGVFASLVRGKVPGPGRKE